eukprot:CAMPEP_0197894242 /NCGR_PEP_ID=MMETSP1439-20131203/34839_1 /TAXON_ID=66791 /ORGANISM="Gonyaulax spinifera, Strain CCMP409" /LENGTH=84 /DNA_ID=CAMNT_0043514567 /DNA_START=44 /DNA_END=296 /DNA_ORIENTATION=+
MVCAPAQGSQPQPEAGPGLWELKPEELLIAPAAKRPSAEEQGPVRAIGLARQSACGTCESVQASGQQRRRTVSWMPPPPVGCTD